MRLFWRTGYSGTSTSTLTQVLGIRQQSLYSAFGSKRKLYLEALGRYQEESTASHIERLNAPASPVAGLRDLLGGVGSPDDEIRRLGCMGVASVNEFSTDDADLVAMREASNRTLRDAVVARVEEARDACEIDATADPGEVAEIILTMMMGLQVAARAGADLTSMRRTAHRTIDFLTRTP
ncbi:TetR/AcrR family transcriptional regulator [Streptomyces sp. HYC2]|uniref:TetR/AcrR family transcriptional regulator n=1 Tax=Streptomyces sp. HYC2 TaxID=2955207 RepID=UPI00248046F6|nr:TetR/AcrR family transcriptional regulator [Streptomyces sp. HYC2]